MTDNVFQYKFLQLQLLNKKIISSHIMDAGLEFITKREMEGL